VPAALAILAAVMGGAPAARATVCPKMAGAEARLAEQEPRARLLWIDAHLSRTGHTARLWAWSWGVGIGASGVASLAVVPLVARGDRVDWYTSAGSAAVGVLPFLFAPLYVAADSRVLHGKVEAWRAAEREDEVCALLSDAESRLLRDADDEREQQAWWLHAGNLAFNAGVTLFLGFGFHHWTSGLINGIAGAAVGEALILTQPTQTIDDLAGYRRGELGPPAPQHLALGYAVGF
jgi:hypothetical protein